MNTAPNQTVKFRSVLKHELSGWIEDGILTGEGAQQLTERYRLAELGRESSRLLALVLFTLGGLLLGGGVISFVAANWEELPVGGKVGMLFTVLLGLHLAGYLLRHRFGWPGLGHALTFCGCLVFGANIGLMAQIFHVSGEWYGAFGAWSLGSLAMAWAARSWITGVLVLATSFVWFAGFADDNPGRAALYPFALAAALLPLAWMVRSRVLYALTWLGVVGAMCVLAGESAKSSQAVLVAMASGGLLVWATGETHRRTKRRAEFGHLTAGLGLVMLAVGAYVWSFKEWWNQDLTPPAFHGQAWWWPMGVAVAIGLTLLVMNWQRQAHAPQRRLLSACVAMASGLIGGSVWLHLVRSGAGLPTLAVNLAALLLAAVALWSGIIDERRGAFWLGALFIVQLITSRFLEYETSLLLKSAAFITCGLAVLLAGASYEKFLRRKEALS